MRDIFNKLQKTELNQKDEIDFLIDTCFLVWVLEHNKEKSLKKFAMNNKVAITSLNAEEFTYICRHLSDKIKVSARKFFCSNPNIFFLELPIHPGNQKAEHEFVRSILPELESKEHDPSDAVLLAAAIKTSANVITRDKHDIFNVHLENFVNKKGINIFKTFP